MTDTGLTNRLRQHSRRAGLMVGITMVLTIAICIGGFATIYAKLNPAMSDFVTLKPKATPTLSASVAQMPGPPPATVAPAQPTATPLPTPQPTTAATAASSTSTATTFKADYEVATDGPRINFRSEPSIEGGSDTIIEGLDPGTPLMYLNQDDTSTGTRWMKFQLQDGTPGWIRQVDVEPVGGNGSSTATAGGFSTATSGGIQPVQTSTP